ncbi:MAG: DUF488 domain-containing protein [Dehalococcoidia bacterium]
MEICTLGFTRKSAAEFFGLLKAAGIERVIDVRLNNVSQLAGFSKRDDLAYFLREICGAAYRHEPLLAPTQELLSDYRGRRISWAEYEPRFKALVAERRIERTISRDLFDRPSALLCSEAEPEHCHRRLVAEHLATHWPDVTIRHLQ